MRGKYEFGLNSHKFCQCSLTNFEIRLPRKLDCSLLPLVWTWAVEHRFLPPATKLGQGNIFRSMCQEFCPRGGGACMAARGHAWQAACMAGGMCGRGACVADTTRYGQWVGVMYPTGMHSCYSVRVVAYIHQLHSVPECGKYYLSPLSEEISLTYHLSPKG